MHIKRGDQIRAIGADHLLIIFNNNERYEHKLNVLQMGPELF